MNKDLDLLTAADVQMFRDIDALEAAYGPGVPVEKGECEAIYKNRVKKEGGK